MTTPEDKARAPGALYLIIHIGFVEEGGALYLERQAINGLRRWSENFERVIVAAPRRDGPPPANYGPFSVEEMRAAGVEVDVLPRAYRADQFLRRYRATRDRIRRRIDAAQYLCFGLGGLFGDWGAVAAFQAHRRGRRFAVWTDRVESEVTRRRIRTAPRLRGRIRSALTYLPMAWLERAAIRRAAIGLFHGMDTYAAYAPYARRAEVVHDIHLGRDDAIPTPLLEAKRAAAGDGPLHIVYAGRVEDMKGPEDWVEVMIRLARDGVAFEAEWIGAGSRLDAMRAAVRDVGLEARVRFSGYLGDRPALLDRLRGAHAFVFCHKTPESPRCLIEALASGTPIIGYASPYSEDLIARHGGGALATVGDVAGLTDALAAIAGSPERRRALIAAAAADGADFNDEAVFRHRSALIREHVGPD